jgi:hypothetical protein
MMNYPIPYSQGNTTYFYANSVNNAGTFNKPMNDRVQISLDYSKLVPPIAVSKVWFEIEPGGVPPLTIDSVVTTATLVTFYVGGGYADMSYNILINAMGAASAVHSDLLVVNVFGEDGCDCNYVSPRDQTNIITNDGELFVNRNIRFFVNATAPTNANLLDRWYNLIDGNWYDYVTDGLTNFWALSSISQPPPPDGGGGSGATGNITIKKMQPLNLDGVTNTFPLISVDMFTPNVTTDNSLFVSIDGVWQEPSAQFSASGSSITFATPPAADSYVFILWIYGGITSG